MTLRLCFLGHAIHTVLLAAQILLPCLTNCYHDRACDDGSRSVGLDSAAAAYQLLPDFTGPVIWFGPARRIPLPGAPPR